MGDPKIKIISGAVCVVINEGKVLLIKRAKEPYKDHWGLIAGKIEFGEHPEETAVRELKEETGLDGEVKGIKGVLSEIIQDKESKETLDHFILFICEMNPLHLNIHHLFLHKFLEFLNGL